MSAIPIDHCSHPSAGSDTARSLFIVDEMTLSLLPELPHSDLLSNGKGETIVNSGDRPAVLLVSDTDEGLVALSATAFATRCRIAGYSKLGQALERIRAQQDLTAVLVKVRSWSREAELLIHSLHNMASGGGVRSLVLVNEEHEWVLPVAKQGRFEIASDDSDQAHVASLGRILAAA